MSKTYRCLVLPILTLIKAIADLSLTLPGQNPGVAGVILSGVAG